MKPSMVLDTIVSAYRFNTSGAVPRNSYIALHIEGPPGVAKSSVVYQAKEQLGINIVEFRFAGSDATDLKGIPDLKSGRTVWATPEELPTDPDWKGIIFFDEIVQGGPMVMSAVTELVLEGRMGTYSLPKGAIIVSAGNRRSDRSAVNEMPRHLADRLCFISVEADVPDFVLWADTHNIRSEITSFIRARPDLLSAFDAQQPKSPSPRGWNFVSSILEMNVPPVVQHTLVSGCVGEGAAIEFLGHLELYGQIPTVEEILANPTTAKMPKGEKAPAMCYAIASNLSRALNYKTAKAVMAYVSRFESEEFAVITVKGALDREAALIKQKQGPKSPVRTHDDVIEWCAKNAHLVI
jgi:hypothetical protein